MYGKKYNPIERQCGDGFCYKRKYGLQIELFAQCLPRNLSCSDIDGMAEVNGHLLFIESKGLGVPLPLGQRIAFEKLTSLSSKLLVIVIWGDCETMEFSSLQKISGGKSEPVKATNTQQILNGIKSWSDRVDGRNADPQPAKVEEAA